MLFVIAGRKTVCGRGHGGVFSRASCFFPGSLYLLAITNVKWLGAIYTHRRLKFSRRMGHRLFFSLGKNSDEK